MTKIVGVRFQRAGKIYYFDPADYDLDMAMHVIVETARGVEMGTVLIPPKEVEDDTIVAPLKPVIRVATDEDERMMEINKAKEILAYELTKLVHGEEEAEKAKAAAKALFGGNGSDENMPTAELDSADLTDGAMGILNILVKSGLAPSASEARRLVQQGGVSVNDEKITDPKAMIKLEGETIVRKGKKAFKKVVVK